MAMGADGPIDGSKLIDAKHFHGKDGIGEVHTTVPPHSPYSWFPWSRSRVVTVASSFYA